MADEFDAHVLADAEALIRLAVGAAGPMTDRVAWRRSIPLIMGEIASLLAEGSPEMELAAKLSDHANSKVFRNKIIAVDVEESSTRAIVTLETMNPEKPEEHEHFRTWRTDTPVGKLQLAQCREAIGRDVLVRLHVGEFMSGTKKRKVRELQHLEVPGGNPSGQRSAGSPPPRQQERPATRPAGGTSGAPAGLSSEQRQRIAELVKGVPSVLKPEMTERLREIGITNIFAPPAEKLPEYEAILLSLQDSTPGPSTDDEAASSVESQFAGTERDGDWSALGEGEEPF